MSYAHTIHRLHEMHLMKEHMTPIEVIELFKAKYPDLCVINYRPIHEVIRKGKNGVSVWLENGDVLVYYPAEAQDKLTLKGDDILTDMGYQNLIRRILSDTIEMPEHVGNMTAADLTLYLNGYATAQKRIVQMIKELSEGPGDR